MIDKFKIQNSKSTSCRAPSANRHSVRGKTNSKSKCQISKQRFCHLIFVLWIYFEFCALSFGINSSYAKEITILYTGETHAMLYPCLCPLEPDGGISRRATLLSQLKKSHPEALILDSGSFFAAGLLDEYTQNTQLDIQRTLVNLKAIELMKYDALAISDDEFNFGKNFLQDNIGKSNLNFLSCNISTDLFKPYIIKEISGIKIGIIGITNPLARQKAGGLKFIELNSAVADTVTHLKEKGVNIIVVLSNLGESGDLNLINDVKGIDILIDGRGRSKEEAFTKSADTLILRPSWQGRKLGKAVLSIEDNKIKDFKIEEIRLSDKISDDKNILSILPQCFSDSNCKKEGFLGTCQDPGTLNSRCSFSQANRIELSVIIAKDCITCHSESVVNFLKRQFSGLVVTVLYYPDRKAAKLVKDLGIHGLPAYLLDRAVEKEKNFPSIKKDSDLKGAFYVLKPQFSGISYFLNRKVIKGKFDLILSLYDKDSSKLLETVKEFNPSIHFLAVQQKDKFDAPGGQLEVEDYLRAVCIKKYYPEEFFNYISCRAANIHTSWWENCANKIDKDKIRMCAKGEDGIELLRENISLNKELEAMFGPAYLVDNQQIFSSKGVPAKEELSKILKR